MPRASTSISIHEWVSKKFRRAYGTRNFSEYVEALVARDLGETLSLEEVKEKVNEAEENVIEWNTKLVELEESIRLDSETKVRAETERLRLIEEDQRNRAERKNKSLREAPEFKTFKSRLQTEPFLVQDTLELYQLVKSLRVNHGIRSTFKEVISALVEKSEEKVEN